MFQLMIALILPAPMHRAGLRLAHGVRVRLWRWRKPMLDGCRVLALDRQGRVLLVRHSYGSGAWMPPGGGMARGEDPVLAAIRELGEELGCGLAGARLVDVIDDTMHGAGNRVHVVRGLAQGTPRPDGREVVAAGFFALEDLPKEMARGVREGLPRWLGV